MKKLKTTLEQWRALEAVIDYGGFAQAAEKLHRSQSSVSHAVNRLQNLLGISLLHIEGRKAVLSSSGKVLLQRSRQLLADAHAIESQAHQLEQGWEAEIGLAVEAAYPTQCLMSALKRFEPISKQTHIRLEEVVLSGAEDALLSGRADLVISPCLPQGFLGDSIIQVTFIAVAHPDHPLHKLNRTITAQDLNRETHIITSDSGSKSIDAGWLNRSHRWSVASLESARKIICSGLGYGWLPEKEITAEIKQQTLKPLPLEQCQRETSNLYLIYSNPDQAGPATRKLAEILTQVSMTDEPSLPPTQ
ncbi:Transcriptional regulator, LysR family [hydrothermal vent metagenome]|uniref:Transcriptional regulator, LysR family n=1 Tax=hydrothermal vent metagenome TaxID=652676 RepID=A0A3B0XRG2_9ZZZZ